MTFRSKLLLAFALTVSVAVGLVSFVVAETTRAAFERLDSQRSAALVAQFRREFERRQAEVVQRTERMADSDALRRIAADTDYAPYLDEARALAAAQGLDFVEITAADGSIISSAQWPARFGYKDEWVSRMGSSGIMTAALKREELPEEVVLALIAVRPITAGERSIYIAAGERLDKNFLASLDLPQGMRAALYPNPPSGASTPDAELVEAVRSEQKELTRVAGAEALHAIPQFGRDKELLAILLIGSSRADMLRVESFIRKLGLAVGAVGVLIGLILAWWATARITRPVHELRDAAREVAAGNWRAHVEMDSSDEIGELAAAFNQMTRQLTEQRERLVQSERVAAWRELARRLAHELKNPLFPLQITVENMQRARDQYPEQFDEVFREGSATLLAELANLKTIINRFSDFSKMPAPERQSTNINELARGVMKLFGSAARRAERGRARRARRAAAGDRGRSGAAASRAAEPGAERARRDAVGRNPHDPYRPYGRRDPHRSRRHRLGTDGRRVRAPVHALLHHQAARHRTGPGHRAVGSQRSWRYDLGAQRARPRRDVPDRIAKWHIC